MSQTEPAVSTDRYIAVPKNGKICPVSGFGHARFYRVIINGEGRRHIRILDLKEPGQTRGTKFVHHGDLIAWLNSRATKAAA